MIEEEISKVAGLKNVGLALVQFAESLFKGTVFESSDRRWVARPHNFVTFEVHWQRANNIALSLRGNPDEFLTFEELPLRAGMGGYSECKITSARHLAAASCYIRSAAELYSKGSKRIRSKPVLLK